MSESLKAPSGTFEAITGKIGRILEIITGKIGQIAALFLAIAALGTAVIKARTAFTPTPAETPSPPPTQPDWTCFHSEFRYPDEVYVGQWDSMKLVLKGWNNCNAKLKVHVAFDPGRGKDQIAIEPRFRNSPNCVLDEDSCWEKKTLASGEFTWKMSPPELIRLKDRLGQPIMVYINTFVYNTETRTRILADTVRFQLKDDPPATIAASTAPL